MKRASVSCENEQSTKLVVIFIVSVCCNFPISIVDSISVMMAILHNFSIGMVSILRLALASNDLNHLLQLEDPLVLVLDDRPLTVTIMTLMHIAHRFHNFQVLCLLRTRLLVADKLTIGLIGLLVLTKFDFS